MGSKSILLLSLLVGGLITWYCYNDHKNSILLKDYQMAHNANTAQGVVTGEPDIRSDKENVHDEINSGNDLSKEAQTDNNTQASENTNTQQDQQTSDITPAQEAVIAPSFSYDADGNMSARLSIADANSEFTKFINKYCTDNCSEDIEYSREIKKAPWQTDAIKIASFLKDNKIKNGSISIKDSQYTIEGKITDSSLAKKLDSLIKPLDESLSGENKILLSDSNSDNKSNESTQESLPQLVNTKPNNIEKIHKVESLAEKQDTINNILKTSPIYFEFNSDKITKESMDILDEIIYILTTLKDYSLEVQGHTDSVGNNAYNKRLSQKRADAVKAYLIKHGVSTDEITSIGYGEERPIDADPTSKINRRVEIHIKGGSK